MTSGSRNGAWGLAGAAWALAGAAAAAVDSAAAGLDALVDVQAASANATPSTTGLFLLINHIGCSSSPAIPAVYISTPSPGGCHGRSDPARRPAARRRRRETHARGLRSTRGRR